MGKCYSNFEDCFKRPRESQRMTQSHEAKGNTTMSQLRLVLVPLSHICRTDNEFANAYWLYAGRLPHRKFFLFP
jgi:hypothetical protein